MNNALFFPAPFFLLRAPLFAIEKITDILSSEENLIEFASSNRSFREAILVASPSLYNALLNEKPDKKNLTRALIKYALRMSTRSTPFGLFSFVAFGSFNDKDNALINTSLIKKKIRPDMGWLYSYLSRLHADPNYLPKLTVRCNPLLEPIAGRVERKFQRLASHVHPNNASIKITPLIKSVLSLTAYPISVASLSEKLTESFPQLSHDKLIILIAELLEKQFLFPGETPSLFSDSFIEKDPVNPEISEIVDLMDVYSKQPIGEGENSLHRLYAKMDKLNKEKNYVHIDAVYPNRVTLPFQIAQEASKAVNLLWKISAAVPKNSLITAYHAKFLEKYGTHRTVPLLELLSSEMGLGTIESAELQFDTNESTSFAKSWKKWLFDQWQTCINSRQQEIILTEDLVDSLHTQDGGHRVHEERAILSFDYFLKILKGSLSGSSDSAHIQLLGPTWQGLSSFGRFMYLFDEETKKQCKDFLVQEENLESNVIFLELSALASQVRVSNIARQPKMRRVQLDLEAREKTDSSLSLNDIFVGSTTERLYLTNRSGDKEICAVTSNVMNLQFMPLPLRFMRLVTLNRYRLIHPFYWGELESKAQFLPRITFGNTILSPRRWRLDGNDFRNKRSEEIHSMIGKWIKDWNLPSRCYLIEHDNRLIVDFEVPLLNQELCVRLKKGESLQFEEHLEEEYIATDQGKHQSEIVLSFQQNPTISTKSNQIRIRNYKEVHVASRSQFLGSDWVYAKIYLSEGSGNQFLMDHLLPFSRFLETQALSAGSFFIRYKDPEFHFRLRIKCKNNQSIEKCILMVSKTLNAWKELGLVSHGHFPTYEREIERYGGHDFCSLVEEFFCADSHSIEPLISILNQGDKIITVSSIIQFLGDLGMDYGEMLAFLTHSKQSQNDLKGFRNHKQRFLDFIRDYTLSKSNNADLLILQNSSKIRASAAKRLVQHSKVLLREDWLDLCHSLLHMHCNRLGCSNQFENQARAYAQHALNCFHNQIQMGTSTIPKSR